MRDRYKFYLHGEYQGYVDETPTGLTCYFLSPVYQVHVMDRIREIDSERPTMDDLLVFGWSYWNIVKE